MSNKRDYYAVLGVSREVSESGLKAAYRKLVKQLHPDINPDNPNAEIQMKEINEAYEILSDPQKRAEYERSGGSAENKRGVKKTGKSFSGEFKFEDFFGAGFNDFVYNGKQKSEPKREQHKSGETCKSCNGTGRKRVETQSAFGKMVRTQECSACGGTGKA